MVTVNKNNLHLLPRGIFTELQFNCSLQQSFLVAISLKALWGFLDSAAANANSSISQEMLTFVLQITAPLEQYMNCITITSFVIQVFPPPLVACFTQKGFFFTEQDGLAAVKTQDLQQNQNSRRYPLWGTWAFQIFCTVYFYNLELNVRVCARAHVCACLLWLA